jgi:hypothetical protein
MNDAVDVNPFVIAMDVFGNGSEACGIALSEMHE